MAKALEANGAAKVYIIGRRLVALEHASKQSVSRHHQCHSVVEAD